VVLVEETELQARHLLLGPRVASPGVALLLVHSRYMALAQSDGIAGSGKPVVVAVHAAGAAWEQSRRELGRAVHAGGGGGGDVRVRGKDAVLASWRVADL